MFYWTDQDYANITIAFKLAYSIGLLTMGALIDKLGVKKGYTFSIAIWSIFGMLHRITSYNVCYTKLLRNHRVKQL